MNQRFGEMAAATWLVTYVGGAHPRIEVEAAGHNVARNGELTVLFDGILHNRAELLADSASNGTRGASDAELLLDAYVRFGDDVVHHVKGLFALVIWNRDRRTLLCARDPHGLHPFFYAEDGADIFLSSSVDRLVRHPRVSSNVDRVAIADHLCHRWPKLEATYFEAVRRLPGGYTLEVRHGAKRVERYWDPIPPGRPIDYLSAAEVSNFDGVFDEAITRCLRVGPAAIYLSGGLDSISVAAVAKQQLDERGEEPLLALSLVFEHPAANEESVQRAVASALELPLEIVTVGEAVGRVGLLASALEMSAGRSAPMLNLWNPAYAHLAQHAKGLGYQTILTGNGGDEWLEAGVDKGRLALSRFDLATVYRIWGTMHRSYPFSKAEVAKNLLWTYGMRPILRQAVSDGLRRAAPRVLRSLQRRHLQEITPAWIARDPKLRDEMFERYREHRSKRSRGALDNAMVAFDLEEFYESGREIGVHLLHPFWDADLTGFLARVPPRMMIRGGYSKGLVRQSLARKFPTLGFDHHRKVSATSFYRSVLVDEGVAAWERLGGAQALAEIGVVDPVALDAHMRDLFRASDPNSAYQIWYVLSVEAWLRGRTP